MGIFSDKIRVGVLRGGPSHEYQVSLNTGALVLENLDRDIYEPVDILISSGGLWHENGFVKPLEKIIKRVEVIFNALHGQYGEDGTVQKLLDHFVVPYTGSGVMGSYFSMNKITSKKIYERSGLKTPFSASINLKNLGRESIREAYKIVPSPFMVKPSSAGSSLGVRVAHTLSELEEMVVAAFEYSPSVLIEEYINGKEATCGVIDDFRNQTHYPLIPILSSHLGDSEREKINQMALLAHKALGLRHYSSSDFIIHPKRGIFILETDSLPTFHQKSGFKEALELIGVKFSDFLHHIIGLAMKKK